MGGKWPIMCVISFFLLSEGIKKYQSVEENFINEVICERKSDIEERWKVESV